jgi:hypothetical protein
VTTFYTYLQLTPDKPEVVKSVIEAITTDRDIQIGHVGEIRQAHAARFVDLTENHVLIGAVLGAPCANPSLQRPAGTRRQPRVAPLHLFEDGNRAKLWCGFQQRDHLGVEEIHQRIRTASGPHLGNGRWKLMVMFKAIGRGGAD